jgi:outer membrane receptor protein involved in Fe transport
VYGDDRRDRVRELAAYGEGSYRLTPDVTLALGARVFAVHTRTLSDVDSENFAPRSLDRSVDFRGVSPKISMTWAISPGNMAYAVASEGYRSGGINSGGAVPLAEKRSTFRPDRLINLEAGLKLEGLSRAVSINSSVFYDMWNNIQTDQYRPSGVPYTINAGDARVLGMETEVAARAGGFTVQVNGRVSAVRISDANSDFTARVVNALPGAPAFSGGALLSYEQALIGDWTLRLVGQFTYVGPSRVTFDASQPKTGGFVRTKLSAEVFGALAGRPVGLQVYALNPLDSFSDTFAFGNPFNPGLVRQITPQRPVTVGITLSAAI